MGDFFDAQESSWFEGGLEWYQRQNGLSDEQMEKEYPGIPSDFDPYEFWVDNQ